MTEARTYIELFEPTIVLSLAHVHDDKYIVWDQSCRYYILSPSPLTFCLRFMRAMETRGDVVSDEASVERATWGAGHSMRVGALSESGGRTPRGGLERDTSDPVLPDSESALSEGRRETCTRAQANQAPGIQNLPSESVSNGFRLRPAEPIDEKRGA